MNESAKPIPKIRQRENTFISFNILWAPIIFLSIEIQDSYIINMYSKTIFPLNTTQTYDLKFAYSC